MVRKSSYLDITKNAIPGTTLHNTYFGNIGSFCQGQLDDEMICSCFNHNNGKPLYPTHFKVNKITIPTHEEIKE